MRTTAKETSGGGIPIGTAFSRFDGRPGSQAINERYVRFDATLDRDRCLTPRGDIRVDVVHRHALHCAPDTPSNSPSPNYLLTPTPPSDGPRRPTGHGPPWTPRSSSVERTRNENAGNGFGEGASEGGPVGATGNGERRPGASHRRWRRSVVGGPWSVGPDRYPVTDRDRITTVCLLYPTGSRLRRATVSGFGPVSRRRTSRRFRSRYANVPGVSKSPASVDPTTARAERGLVAGPFGETVAGGTADRVTYVLTDGGVKRVYGDV